MWIVVKLLPEAVIVRPASLLLLPVMKILTPALSEPVTVMAPIEL
jgi:hypothetical protein